MYVSQFPVIKNEARTSSKKLFLLSQIFFISSKIVFLFLAIPTTKIIKINEHRIRIAKTSYAPMLFSSLKYMGKSPQEK